MELSARVTAFAIRSNLPGNVPNQTLQIDLNGFDGFITTCPLNLQPLNTPLFLQTVHDLIPLEYGRTTTTYPAFSIACWPPPMPAGFRLRGRQAKFHIQLAFGWHPHKFRRHPNAGADPTPSLQFPGDALDWEARSQRPESALKRPAATAHAASGSVPAVQLLCCAP